MSHSPMNRRDALFASAGLAQIATAPSASAQSTSLKDIEAGVSVSPGDAAEIWAVLDKFLINFRMPVADNIDKSLETMLFPHVRIANHQIVVFPDAKSYKNLSLSHKDDFLQPGWDHTEWAKRRIVQADKEKVHVATVFDRFKKDNDLIATETSLYILEKIDGYWGIRGRSSFAK